MDHTFPGHCSVPCFSRRVRVVSFEQRFVSPNERTVFSLMRCTHYSPLMLRLRAGLGRVASAAPIADMKGRIVSGDIAKRREAP